MVVGDGLGEKGGDQGDVQERVDDDLAEVPKFGAESGLASSEGTEQATKVPSKGGKT